MKEIRLLKLTLKDFQGGNFVLTPEGEDVNVYGDNSVGKTRLMSAFTFLLFGKDSLNRADFSIKNLNATGEVAERGIEHTVEASLLVDGEPITLKKIYSEKWTKQRGRAESVFSGHSTQHYYQGVPIQEKEYKTYIQEIAGDEETFRLLTSPTAFPLLDWKKQRNILLTICGDISDQDVIASDSKLSPLTAILGKRSIDDHKKVITARRSEINKELEKVPARIDENRRMLPDTTGIDKRAVEGEVTKLETALNASKLKLQGVDTGGEIAELSKKLAGINADIQKIESQHYSDTMQTVNRLNQRISEIESKAQTDGRRLTSLSSEIAQKNAAVSAIERDLQTHRDKWTEIDAETFQNTTIDTCPACPCPSERVQEAREKALAAFNVWKSKRLTEIEQIGQRYAYNKERLQAEIKALSKEHAELLLASTGETDARSLITERDSVKLLATSYDEIPGHQDYLETKADIERQIKEERDGKLADVEKVRTEVAELQLHLDSAKADADKFTRRESGEKRIQELMIQEKTLAVEFEKLEHELYLCEQFIRTKVSMLTDRINGMFEITSFKLFEQQVNGGLSECCEITVGGIPYNGGLNSAARTNAGMDVIRLLSKHYQLSAPIFVDNAESVCELLNMNTQVVRLIVSEPDKVLRIETAKKKMAVAA